jgi:hypothetical protein
MCELSYKFSLDFFKAYLYRPGMVAHTYNSNFLGVRDGRITARGHPEQKVKKTPPHLNQQAGLGGAYL